ncbi:High-affinity glucose transporter SNF3 [Lachnellula arida]|uniref:High-affinity glucose transporter SNF3 n=1 Tax=Lachnellula arida TaxID=1316785 RepID=A0A8T9BE80_9HELO|nr:High-affinity glucose transporter SNF3 [Lachnellula arida]
MAGGPTLTGTTDTSRIEAPVTIKAYLMCAFAAFGGVFFGYDTGWMGGIMGMKYYIRQYTGLAYPGPDASQAEKDAFVLPGWQQSLLTGILSCGTFSGSIIAGDVADRIGRRWTIIVGCVTFSIGCILETASTSLAVMVVGRLIAGSGVGFISAIIILYMSEIAPKKVRGALVAGYQFCITIGILLANCVVYATQSRDDTGSYRIPIAVQFLWAIILGGGLFFLPESPRYFVKKGKLDSAAKALSSVRGQPVQSQYIQDELSEIIANHEYELSVVPQTSYMASWTNCFRGGLSSASSNLRRTLLGIGLQMMQQLTGINFIFYYGVVFFASLKTISNPFLISLVTTLVNVLSTPVSFWMVERFGRRNLLIFGGTGMVISQYIVGIIGVTVGVGLSTSSNWFWNCIIAIITPYLVDKQYANLSSKIFFMWGSLCVISVLFAYFLVPETKGLSLEQVDRMLEEVIPRKSRGWVPHSTFASDMRLEDQGITLNNEKHGVSHVETQDSAPNKSFV